MEDKKVKNTKKIENIGSPVTENTSDCISTVPTKERLLEALMKIVDRHSQNVLTATGDRVKDSDMIKAVELVAKMTGCLEPSKLQDIPKNIKFIL